MAERSGKSWANEEPRSFPFFKLPLELRREVYSYVLIQDKQPLRLSKKTSAQRRVQNHSLAVLTTSRRVNLEAYPISLSVNTFEIWGTAYEWQWLRKLGGDGQKALRKVVCTNLSSRHTWTAFRSFNILAACPKLSLTITIHFHELLSLYRHGVFNHLHGFSRATCSLATVEQNRDLYPYCRWHGNRSRYEWAARAPSKDSWDDYGAKAVQILLEMFSSECPKNCHLHKSRPESHSASTLHIVYGYGCPDCNDHPSNASSDYLDRADRVVRYLW